MKLKTLYNKREDGQLQEWTIEVVDNTYRTIAGMCGGKMQTSSWTCVAGKNIGKANETLPSQQAAKEAQSKWQKRIDLGDRTDSADLGNDGIFFPMLAKKFEDFKDSLSYPLYCQPKLDGIRVIATKDGLFTRNGKRHHSLKHIEDSLAPLFKKYPGLVIDGEGYADKLSKDFNKICSLIKKQKPSKEELAESARLIKYHVYDCKPDSVMKFSDRINYVGRLIKDLPGITLVNTRVISSRKFLDEVYGEYLAAGYEGQMVRIDAPYENKRSKSLMKRKEFSDSEFKILDVCEGKGNRAGTAGYMVFKSAKGVDFTSNIKGNFEHVTQLLKDRKQLIGKSATIKYFGLGDNGVPRFPFVIAIRDYE